MGSGLPKVIVKTAFLLCSPLSLKVEKSTLFRARARTQAFRLMSTSTWVLPSPRPCCKHPTLIP